MGSFRRLALVTFGLLATHCDNAGERLPPLQPEVIENQPGTLVITSPARGDQIEAASGSKGPHAPITVRGTGATGALTINGEAVDVAADGSFEAKVTPTVGLNLIVAVDGDARLETPFLFGHFAPASETVKQAIAIDVGADAVGAPLPSVSLASVTNLALEGRDLIAMLRGQTFGGNNFGVTWSFTVTGGTHERPMVHLASSDVGLGIDVVAKNLVVDGDLSMVFAGLEYKRPVRITVARTEVMGAAKISVEPQTGALGVEMPDADAYLDGFQFRSDNGGFPCCVDGIVNGFLHPKVEEGIKSGVRDQLPSALKLTLEGAGLPNEIDLSATGVPLKLGVRTALDAGSFDSRGGIFTASALFDGRFTPDSPGAKAPGWLSFGSSFDIVKAKRSPAFGASISIDAINQAFFAAWGSGTLAYTAPVPFKAKLTPMMPPVVAITSKGALRLGLGEVQVQREGSPGPLAAATVLQDVTAKVDGSSFILEPQGEPTISVTYLADGNVGSGLNLIANAAKEQMGKFLKPLRIPVPEIALDALGGGFVRQSLSVAQAQITIDSKTGRIGVAGAMALTKK